MDWQEGEEWQEEWTEEQWANAATYDDTVAMPSCVDDSSWHDAQWAAELQETLQAVGIDASPEAAVEYFDLRSAYAQTTSRRYTPGKE